tara:strand:+ start:7852 stop:8703 length:852 start_codon:yes stop_codon:yes gene_type:complete
MLTVVQSVYNKNPLIAKSTINQINSLDTLGIEFQFILYNDNGDPSIIDDIPKVVSNHEYFEYYYADFNFGYKTAPGGFVGAKDLIKYPFVHSSNQDDFYSPVFYSLCLKNLLALDETYAAVCMNCYHVNEEFEIEGIPLPDPSVEDEVNKAWSNPTFMFDWMFGIDGDKLTKSDNFIYFPGTIFRKELYEKIGTPDFKNFGGSGDFEYWARAVFNGYKFKYLSLPTWYYMQSSYSHSRIAKETGDDRVTTYMPRIKEKYQNLWLSNNKKVRDVPKITEDIFWS